MSPTPAPSPTSGGTPNVAGMVADPQFKALSAADQRTALSKLTGDQSFLKLSDAETAQFTQKVAGAPATTAPAAAAPPPESAASAFGSAFGTQWKNLGHTIMHPLDAVTGLARAIAQPVTDAHAAYVQAGGGWKGIAAAAMAADAATNVNSPLAKGLEQSAEAHPTHPVAAIAGNLAGQFSQLALGEGAGRLIGAAADAAPDAASAVRRVAVGPSPADIEPVKAATIALRPRNSIPAWPQKVATALPDIRRAADNLGMDPSSVSLADTEKAVAQAKADVWTEFEQNHLKVASGATVSTQPVANAIAASAGKISQITAEARPGLIRNIADAAALYDGRTLPMDQIELRIQNLNNELRSAQGGFKGSAQAFRNDPAQSFKFAELDALRKLEADTFNQISGPGSADLKARYGALKTVEDTLDRRINVAQRQNPVGAFQGIGRMAGVGNAIQGGMNALKGNLADGLSQLAKGAYQFRVGQNIAQLGDPEVMMQQALSRTVPRAPVEPFNPAVRPVPRALPAAPVEVAHPGNPNPVPPQAFLGGGVVRGPGGAFRRVPTEQVPLARSPLVAPNPVPDDVPVRLGIESKWRIVRDPKTGRMMRVRK